MKSNKNTSIDLDHLPREELRRMLTEELQKPTSEIDDTFVRLLMAKLNSMGSDPALIDDAAVDEACAKFRENTRKAQVPRNRWHQSWILKVASILLVLGVLFFALPGSAEANDINDVLSWWSDGIFRFFNPGKQIFAPSHTYETDHPGLQQIYDAVTELGITATVVPNWVPDGFELLELETFSMAENHSVYANLGSNGKTILISITIRDENMVFQHEKDKSTVTVWDLAGYEHYVISNNGERIVTWIVNGVECVINSDCSEEDIYRIVKSIYAAEG